MLCVVVRRDMPSVCVEKGRKGFGGIRGGGVQPLQGLIEERGVSFPGESLRIHSGVSLIEPLAAALL